MAVTSQTFLASYPEFANAPATLIAAKLAEATQRTSPVLGDTFTYAVMLRAAILLWYSPLAREMRIADKTTGPRWEKELHSIQRVAAFGYRTT